MQQGWDRSTNKEKKREEEVRETVEKVMERERERREREVGEMVKARRSDEEQRIDGGDVDRVLSRGFGHVKGS